MLLEEIVTTEAIDFSEAATNLFLSLVIKYHEPEKVNNITKKSGFFKQAIHPITYSKTEIMDDGCIRENSSLESMANLSPVLGEDTSITAATASPLTDGASFMIICSEDFANKHNLKPMARINSGAVIGCNPDEMGIGPIEASRLALKRAGWDIEDVDIFELNEAFSSQSIAVINALSIPEEKMVMELIDSSPFQRLRRIKQLGPAYLTFHGAESSRFTHSLGVFHLARRAINHLSNFDSGLKEHKFILYGAALLHDLGHGPLSHTSEEIFKIKHESWSAKLINSSQEITNILNKYGKSN